MTEIAGADLQSVPKPTKGKEENPAHSEIYSGCHYYKDL